MSVFSNNLRFLRESKGLKLDDFDSLGIKKGTMSNYELGNTEPKFALLCNLSKFFGISIDDFLNRELNKDGNSEDSENPTSEYVASKSTDPGVGIPLIPVEAMAGFGSGEQTVLEYECERYVIPMFHEAEFLIPVKGSSMIPKYNSGDIVACKKLSLQDLFFQWNKVYVLDTAQGALIKRVKKGSDTNHITCISDNTNYEPFELLMSQINSVAIVIGVVRLE